MKPYGILVIALAARLGTEALAAEAPRSSHELLGGVTAALKSKQVEEFLSLYSWENVDPSMRVEQERSARKILSHDVTHIQLAELPQDMPMEFIRGDTKYKPNVELRGMIQIDFANTSNGLTGASIPYGSIGDQYYLANVIKEKIPGEASRDNQLNVSVLTFPASGPFRFKGYFAYAQGQNVLTNQLSEAQNVSTIVFGDHVLACVIESSGSSSNAWAQLVISENGSNVFKSARQFGASKIDYQREP